MTHQGTERKCMTSAPKRTGTTPYRDLTRQNKLLLGNSTVHRETQEKVLVQTGPPIIGWKHRPKVSICPHQEDYCDTCSKRKEEIRAKQTTINRLLASASADAKEISRLEDEKKSLKQALECHRYEAPHAHKYYVDTTKKCGQESTELEGKAYFTDEEKERLTVMKNKFTIVVSADYQMSKLTP